MRRQMILNWMVVSISQIKSALNFLMWIKFWFVTVISKYLKFATFSKDLLRVLYYDFSCILMTRHQSWTLFNFSTFDNHRKISRFLLTSSVMQYATKWATGVHIPHTKHCYHFMYFRILLFWQYSSVLVSCRIKQASFALFPFVLCYLLLHIGLDEVGNEVFFPMLQIHGWAVKLGMLPHDMIESCLTHMLQEQSKHSLEKPYTLLTTTGQHMRETDQVSCVVLLFW
jgi:hypothetical protein